MLKLLFSGAYNRIDAFHPPPIFNHWVLECECEIILEITPTTEPTGLRERFAKNIRNLEVELFAPSAYPGPYDDYDVMFGPGALKINTRIYGLCSCVWQVVWQHHSFSLSLLPSSIRSLAKRSLKTILIHLDKFFFSSLSMVIFHIIAHYAFSPLLSSSSFVLVFGAMVAVWDVFITNFGSPPTMVANRNGILNNKTSLPKHQFRQTHSLTHTHHINT